MKGLRLPVFAICVILFLGGPYIPDMLLKATVDTTMGVFILLISVLATLYLDPVLAIAVFLAAGSLFLENRKRIISRINQPKTSSVSSSPGEPASVETLSVGAPDLVEGEVHPEHEEPSVEEHTFEPKDSSDEFHGVGESINEKIPLEGAVSNSSRAAAEHLTRAGVVE